MFKAAVIQMRSGKDPSTTAASLESVLVNAIAKGAQYIQTPEMTGCLHSSKHELLSSICAGEDDPIVAMVSRLSAKYNVTIHIGSTAIKLGSDRVANRAFFFQNGELKATYDKLHMFDVDLDNGESWRESSTYQAGNQAMVVEINEALFGLGICYDIRFPQLFREQAQAGAQVLTAPAAFTQQTGAAHWHVLQRARAIENGAFMVSAAQGGQHADGRETYGHSIIVGPWGEILAEIPHANIGIAFANIDVNLAIKAREKIPNLKNNRDYDIKLV